MDINEKLLPFAIANKKGLISDDELKKSFLKVSNDLGWMPDANYNAIVNITLKNYIKGYHRNDDILKALKLGQTKIVDGVEYIVKLTPSGKLDWRVKNPKKKKKQSKDVNLNDLFDNDDFPKKLSKLKNSKKTFSVDNDEVDVIVKTDDNLNADFIIKKSKNKEFLKNEAEINAIYKLLGADVLEQQIEENQTDVLLVKRDLEKTTDVKDFLDDELIIEDLSKFTVLDALLGNTDIYFDENGFKIDEFTSKVIRYKTDDGLKFNSDGSKKDLDDLASDDLYNILTNHPDLTRNLTMDDLSSQVKQIWKKRKAILNLISDDDMKSLIAKRILDLKMTFGDINSFGANKDSHRDFSHIEVKMALNKANGNMFEKDDNVGWKFLSELCKMRGFDKQPELLDDKEFDKELNDKKSILVHRGLTDGGGKTALELKNEFVNSETAFYGFIGMYGAGIYAGVNESKKLKNKNDRGYNVAYDYGGRIEDNVLDIIIPSDAKVIDAHDLDEMMYDEFFGKEFKKLRTDFEKAKKEQYQLKDKIEEIYRQVEDKVKKEWGWNDEIFDKFKYERKEFDFVSASDFDDVVDYYKDLAKDFVVVKKIDNDNYRFSIKGSIGDDFLLNRKVAEIAIKQKNPESPEYNYHYQMLREFMLKEHFGKIQKKVKSAIKNASMTDKSVLDMKKKIEKSQNKIDDISKQINDYREKQNEKANSRNDIIAKIARRPGGEYRGFYAAIKGYDVVIEKNAWGGQFAIILNRKILKVKNYKGYQKSVIIDVVDDDGTIVTQTQ